MTPVNSFIEEDPMEIVLDLIYETGERSNWLNRFFKKSLTHVLTLPRHHLTSLGDVILL